MYVPLSLSHLALFYLALSTHRSLSTPSWSCLTLCIADASSVLRSVTTTCNTLSFRWASRLSALVCFSSSSNKRFCSSSKTQANQQTCTAQCAVPGSTCVHGRSMKNVAQHSAHIAVIVFLSLHSFSISLFLSLSLSLSLCLSFLFHAHLFLKPRNNVVGLLILFQQALRHAGGELQVAL